MRGCVSTVTNCVCVCTVTAANSEVAKVGETFIQLKLTIDKGNDKVEAVPMGERWIKLAVST